MSAPRRLLTTACVTALALTGPVGGGLALAGAPDGPRPVPAPQEELTRLGKGTGNFCLTPGATRALATAHVRLTAIRPARPTGTHERPCVTTPITGGAVNRALTRGEMYFDGGFDFTRGARHLRVNHLKADLATGRVSGDVRGARPARTAFLAFKLDREQIRLASGKVNSGRIVFTLTDQGAASFKSAFGAAPVKSGDQLFEGVGSMEVRAPQPSHTQRPAQQTLDVSQ
ncbi:hypothetical protein CP973_24695 [Streptomyces albofaciens JCM 4342]|uniref:hypothetical protein n=1 Tax=Streptomyces albofaciens TaxID=66866 RepID=UPI0012396239|nr:hypothetical protein [Streptomyces albofaciens]KAA6212578.1 hypothetical protein CP973_24695 [Streptomyces albofaciens JCM 4342]